MKEKGILLSLFSLPSKYGVGDIGHEAYEFIDILSENGIQYWELLPINSSIILPYSPTSYYALEEDHISLDKLYEQGLISKPVTRPVTDRAVYDEFKVKYYEEAFKNFKPTDDYERFKIDNPELENYTKYMVLKFGRTAEYYYFLQYIMQKQWMELKAYANSKNVKLIGDMPVYPPFDSAETMFHSECFQMRDGKFIYEAGTPPDYFNENGQKWDSPVYNMDYLKETGFKYLLDRYRFYFKIFDKVRIDYFRGYDSFFQIPYGKSGKEGFYVDGGSYEFFDKLLELPGVTVDRIIVEDLGDIRDETVALRNHYGFQRIKILQFAVDLANGRDYDNEQENVIVYPSNHDCSTIYGWYKELNNRNKENLKAFLRNNGCNDINVNHGVFQYCNKSKANTVIVQVQDLLGLDDYGRINYPGTDLEENWTWKLRDFEDLRKRIQDINL